MENNGELENYNEKKMIVKEFFKSLNLTEPIDISDTIIDSINNIKPILFLKFGDGEYNCIFNPHFIKNCDNDTYTNKLSESLKHSIIYITNSNKPYYIGRWNNRTIIDDYNKLCNTNINYADYHTFIVLGDSHMEGFLDKKKVKIYKAIKMSKIKKIMICNPLMIKAEKLLDIDYMVFIPLCNWFDNFFENILNNVEKIINDNNCEPHIILTCCGMSAKVLICELSKKYENSLYFDIGSGLDFLCRKEDTRGYKNLYSYEYLCDLFKELLNDDF